jgi:uncharacterized membrane protein YkvA (DUF1232 family)
MLRRIRLLRAFRIASVLFGVVSDFPALLRMCRSLISGSYSGISPKSVFRILFALCYLFFFVDLVPDFIPLIGWVDDIAVLVWVISSLKEEIESFRKWEAVK